MFLKKKSLKLRLSVFLNIALLIVSMTLIYVVIKTNNKDNQIVASVGKKGISKKAVDKKMTSLYQDTSLNELINESLIDQQFEKYNKKITEKDQLTQLSYLQKIKNTKKDLTDKKIKKEVNENIKIKFLAKKLGVMSDAQLKDFLTNQKNDNGDKIIKVTEIIGSHDKLKKLEGMINKKDEFNQYISSNKLKSTKNAVFSLYNDYDIDFSNAKVGDYKHIMNDHSNDMALIIVDSIEKTDDNVFNLNKNRSVIENVYYSKNFGKVKVNLINQLKKLFVITKKV